VAIAWKQVHSQYRSVAPRALHLALNVDDLAVDGDFSYPLPGRVETQKVTRTQVDANRDM
jgi:hypothetical protein